MHKLNESHRLFISHFSTKLLYFILIVDKCDRCHVDANCIGKGVCVCREGYKGDGVHHCEKTSK